MYDPEIYRHPISDYYNPYVLDAEMQAGKFNSDSVRIEPAPFLASWLKLKRKKAQILILPTRFAYVAPLHPPRMSNIASLAFCSFKAIDFLVFLNFSGVFWATQEVRAAGTHRIRVQGTQETDAFSFVWCRYRPTFAPVGFCWQRCFTFSSHQLFWIVHQSIWNGPGGKGYLRRATEECRETYNDAHSYSCKCSKRWNNMMRLQVPSIAHDRKQENASRCIWRWLFTLFLVVALPSCLKVANMPFSYLVNSFLPSLSA